MYPELLIAINVCVCVLMIFLGAFQRRHLDRYSIMAIWLACMDGVGSVLIYGRTEFFPAAAFGWASILLIHGAVVHFPVYECADPLRSCPAFRCRFVCNHETWICMAIVAGLVSAFRV
jgi:hypothetical protein